MHKFLRAIGFSQFDTRKKVQSLVRACVLDCSEKMLTENGEETMLAEYCKDFSPYFGIAVCGELDDDNNKFSYDYYYPSYFGAGRFEKPMIVGGDVKCLCCETRPIGDSDKMMCIGCADEEAEEAEDYCGICGEPIWSVDDAVYMEGLFPYCNDCFDALGEDLQECHTCHRPIDTSNPYRSRQAYRDGYWYCGPCEDRRAHLEGIRVYMPANMPSNETIFEWDDAQLWESTT